MKNEYYLDKFLKSVIKYCLKRNSFISCDDNEIMTLIQKLENRNKSHGYKKQNYCENFYYITTKNRLAVIKSKGHNTGKSLGELLVRRGKITKFTHQAQVEIDGGLETYGIKGVIIKHNRVLDDLKGGLSEKVDKYLRVYFDANESCTMTIDKRFDLAYEPSYRYSRVYKIDLCSSSSCMSCRGPGAQSFYGNIPCCSVVRFEDKGEQVGRCIMYEYNGKRHFIRIYGKPEYLPTLYNKLKAEIKENDMFGRGLYIEDLEQETTISDDDTNMYLDGNGYGMFRFVNDSNPDDIKYVMCTDYNTEKVRKKYPGYKGTYSSMKSTSSDEVQYNFHTGHTCDCCGSETDEDDEIWIGDSVYCSSGCAEEAGYRMCNYCGEWENEDNCIYIEGENIYCCPAHAHKDGYYECPDCHRWFSEDDLTTPDGWDEGLCEECLDDAIERGEVAKCDWCGDYLATDYAHKVIYKDTRQIVYLCDYDYDQHLDRYDEIKEDDASDNK